MFSPPPVAPRCSPPPYLPNFVFSLFQKQNKKYKNKNTNKQETSKIKMPEQSKTQKVHKNAGFLV